jgi:AcrR family transcriptional regulator
VSELGLRERQKQHRRNAIISSAMRLFAERGYDETTIADIAELADVSPRTVLTYFETKEEMAREPLANLVNRLPLALEKRQPQESTLAVFGNWLQAELSDTEGDTSNAWLWRMLERNPQMAALQMANTDEVAIEMSQALAKDLGCQPDDLKVEIVLSALSGVCNRLFQGRGLEDRLEAVKVAVAFVDAGTARLADYRRETRS